MTTQLKTEVPLVINGKTTAPGTCTLFIDLKSNHWTLIVSNWKVQTHHDPKYRANNLVPPASRAAIRPLKVLD